MHPCTSRHWATHFRNKRLAPPPTFPWDHSYRLSPTERDAIASSLQQFQLGEGSDGRRLLQRAEAWARHSGDIFYVESLREFITEEQRHSRWLGAFMGQNGIPKLKRQWVDDAFRHVRRWGGLEGAITVLVSAEAIAVPYYAALRDATGSPLLKAICTRILADEAEHLVYQGRTLGLLRGRAFGIRWALHELAMEAVCLLVWKDHRGVFQRAGVSFVTFRGQSHAAFQAIRAAAQEENAQVAVLSSM